MEIGHDCGSKSLFSTHSNPIHTMSHGTNSTSVPSTETNHSYLRPPGWRDFAACNGLTQLVYWYWLCKCLCIYRSRRGHYCLKVYTWSSIGTMHLCSLCKWWHLAAGCCIGSALRLVSYNKQWSRPAELGGSSISGMPRLLDIPLI